MPSGFQTKTDKAVADLCPLFEGEDGLHKLSQVPSDSYFYDYTFLQYFTLSPT